MGRTDDDDVAASHSCVAGRSHSWSGLSIPHFSLLFKLKTGCCPVDFFNRLRIQKACQRLITTDLSVKEVAFSLGYTDPYYFSRSFKKTMGVSPLGYKEQFLVGGNARFIASVTYATCLGSLQGLSLSLRKDSGVADGDLLLSRFGRERLAVFSWHCVQSGTRGFLGGLTS